MKSRFYERKYHPSIIDIAYNHALTCSRGHLKIKPEDGWQVKD